MGKLTSYFKEVGEEHNQLGSVRSIKDDAIERSSDEVGDAESGQTDPVQPFLGALAAQVVPHRRQDDAIFDTAR